MTTQSQNKAKVHLNIEPLYVLRGQQKTSHVSMDFYLTLSGIQNGLFLIGSEQFRTLSKILNSTN